MASAATGADQNHGAGDIVIFEARQRSIGIVGLPTAASAIGAHLDGWYSRES